jgi:Trp operon repressor
MDPFELLKKDHQTVSKLFERIEAATGRAKLEIFQRIKDELELHTHIEEVIFYPALEKENQTRDLTLEAYEEHRVVKKLLGELDAARSVTDEWKAKLTVLKENVEHHVDEEENELFDKANDVLTGEEAESLGERMKAEKVKLGGNVPQTEVAAEKPGLLRKLANTLGVGSSSQKTTRTTSKRNSATKKTAKKSGKTAVKSGRSASTTSANSSSSKKGSGAEKSTKAAKAKPRSKSVRKGMASKPRGSSAAKKGIAKKTGRRG